MPIVKTEYNPMAFLKYSAVNTTYASKLRRVEQIKYSRERFELKDGDFIDVDWNFTGSRKLLVVMHGLGGHSGRTYVRGMISLFRSFGYDSAAFNMRGCSGETNRLISTYHSGRTQDLREVVAQIKKKKAYDTMVLAGFSLGGNLILKYLGEEGSKSQFSAAISVSAPIELVSCSAKISSNEFYMNYFLKKLKPYLLQKRALFPEISLEGFENIKNFQQYDDRYTAPFNGFKNSMDYWKKASALPYVHDIKTPTLLVNAHDDPVLSDECFPEKIALRHKFFHLASTDFGGHVGFVRFFSGNRYYHEKLAEEFILKYGLD